MTKRATAVPDSEFAAAFEKLAKANEEALARACRWMGKPAGSVLRLLVTHRIQSPNTRSGNFSFVSVETVTPYLEVEWTGDGVRVVDLEKQIARHRAALARRVAARLN